MKATDLMIGDWVLVPKTYAEDKVMVFPEMLCQVVSVHSDGCIVKGEYTVSIPYEALKPIPLTAEILEKNGFEWDGRYATLTINENSWLEYYHHEHRLRKWWSGIDEWENNAKVKDITFQCNCYHVHELQHALRMCGINKEIEL